MTREQAYDNIEWFGDHKTPEQVALVRIIDKIYDDFESRTCEGCRYGSYDNIFQTYLPKDYQEACETCIRNMNDNWEQK